MVLTSIAVIFVSLLMFPLLVGRIVEDIGLYFKRRRVRREMERMTREIMGKHWRR